MILGSPEAAGEVMPGFVPALKGAVVTGKYGPGHQPAYDVRRALIDAGIDVAFPLGDTPIRNYSGYTFSDPAEECIPFDEMQKEVFRLIEQNPYSVLCPGKNGATRTPGYLGFSAAHELCWSIRSGKPVVSARYITEFSRYVPQRLVEIIRLNERRFIVCDPCSLSIGGLHRLLASLPERVDYEMSDEQSRHVFLAHRNLLEIELHRWFSWAQKTERDFAAGLRQNWINERYSCANIDPRAYLPWQEMLSDPDAMSYKHFRHVASVGV